MFPQFIFSNAIHHFFTHNFQNCSFLFLLLYYIHNNNNTMKRGDADTTYHANYNYNNIGNANNNFDDNGDGNDAAHHDIDNNYNNGSNAEY